MTTAEPGLAHAVHEKLYRQVNVGPLLAHPYDYLGEFVAQHQARGWNPNGFYPTPHTVVECMVRMMLHGAGEGGHDVRLCTINDPCVGSGRMLLHGSNYSLRLFGQDVDSLAVAMCKINGAVYAPWLSFPLAASVLGNHPEPRPASLSVPNAPAEGVPMFRVDGRAQRVLFE